MVDDDDREPSVEHSFAWCVSVGGAVFSVFVVAHVLRASGFAPSVQ